MKQKKGQAAMEFLMTYGWAILVVLLAIGALAYSGILTPDRLVAEKTTFATPIPNLDTAVITGSSNSFEIALQNNKGAAITLPLTGTVTPETSTTCANAVVTASYAGSAVVANTTQIPNGETFLMTWDCDDLGTTPNPGTRFKADAQFNYINVETGQQLSHTGNVNGVYS